MLFNKDKNIFEFVFMLLLFVVVNKDLLFYHSSAVIYPTRTEKFAYFS
jgi:hypothetical protein